MATTGMSSYAVHYDLSAFFRSEEDSFLQDFSQKMRLEKRTPLYVAMATWIPKCNMYQHQEENSDSIMEEEKIDCQPQQDIEKCEINRKEEGETSVSEKQEPENPIKKIEEKLTITPKKSLSPKQVQKKLESEKKRQLKEKEREERERKKQQEKEEKEKLRKEKEEKKRKERDEKEAKRKEKEEEKEAKRKEKEKELEVKRKEKEEKEKEKEQEKLRKQQELDEKNREKQKIEEQKQKAAQVFANFFVPKKTETAKTEERKMFMPFEVKSDMRLAPLQRAKLSDAQKNKLEEYLDSPKEKETLWLEEIKVKKIGKSGKTWPFEDDVIVVEEDFGDSILEEEKSKTRKMRVKFLKFSENRRPAYYGTWSKKSRNVNGRKPFAQDKIFDYEVDSDDDWEEEEQGESLNGSDDEDKENEENEDYEVDNDFFVPHGHLSDDEVDEEESSKLSPESHKEKLKLLKDEFELDMQAKINRMKPRSIGCVFYKKDKNVDEAIDRYLKPLAMITNGQIILKKRKLFIGVTPSKVKNKELSEDLMVPFLKLIEGNVNKKISVVEEFIAYLQNNKTNVEFSKAFLVRCVKKFAKWKKCTSDGPMLNKFCWCVDEEVKKKYNVE